MKTYQKVLCIIGIVVAALIALAILGFLLLVWMIGEAAEDIGEKIDASVEAGKQVDRTYESIPETLMEEGRFPDDMEMVGYTCYWASFAPDRSHRYYFYIPKDQYQDYQHYWLEDVPEAEYSQYVQSNGRLGSTGDYVFRAVEIDDFVCTSDREYGNLALKADVTYYHATVYDSALYYKYIDVYEKSDGTKRYEDYSNSVIDWESASAEYLFHQELGSWVVEELHFD